MRPNLHPSLVNGRTGDPALFIETLFESRAILFDLGDISALPRRKLHRLEHIFVSHAHIDHFIGFDRLLRLLVGREKRINLYGPEGFIDNVNNKLRAYRWNLVDRFADELIIDVTEIDAALQLQSARFRLKTAFTREGTDHGQLVDSVLHSEPTFRVSTAILDHRTPSLAFVAEEVAHVNVWKSRLAELGLPVGPWLHQLKRAVIENRPDDHLIQIGAQAMQPQGQEIRLGNLRSTVTITPGQKIAYVTDAADTSANRATIVALARNADLLFIEAAFAQADAALAAERAHLTTVAAGRIAREAGVRRVEPFHFSPRYSGEEERMLNEVMTAFAGQHCAGSAS